MLEAEKFILLIRTEAFDYTKWQHNLWTDKTVDEIFEAAKAFEQNQSGQH